GGVPFVKGELKKNQDSVRASVKYYNYSKSSYSIGVRYMISKTFGIRANYHHHYFYNSEEYPTLRTHTIGIDGVYSFSSFRPEGRVSKPRKWNILAYAGGGYTIGKYNSKDKIISGVIGATLQYRLNSSLALTIDPLTLQFNSFQDNSFSPNVEFKSVGNNLERLFKPEAFWYPSVGVQIYFGKWRQHVDWR
ncbi:MAG TPA: hypothetical protein VKZ78_02445, partial [Sphingobacteriaceae bacterium]|nr:hypothetical protein [Sphingobacteriaceae bacterium]